MFNTSPVSSIKKAQRESAIYRLVLQLFHQEQLNGLDLNDLHIQRVSLNDDRSMCMIYFYSSQGEAYFNKMLETLKLYKPSLRKAIARTIQGRYTPEIVFRFDEQFDKIQKIESLIEKAKLQDQEQEKLAHPIPPTK
jgi:ribosome-binding factor A